MRALLRFLSWFAAVLPLRGALAIGRGLGFVAGRLLRLRRREVIERIRRSFPGEPQARIVAWTNGMYTHFGQVLMEVLRMGSRPVAETVARVDSTGFQPLHEALSQGRGALVVCAHMGNWEMLAASAAQNGIPLGIVVKDLKPPALNEHIIGLRERHGVAVLRRKGALRAALRHIRAGRALGFMIDQNSRREEGVFADFFGQPACTSRGLAQLAVTTGAPTVSIFIVREAGGRHRVIHGPVIPPPADLSEPEVQRYTRAALATVEEAIRQAPEQWIWMHRRWRTRPLDESTLCQSP